MHTGEIRTVVFDFDGTLHDSMYIYERAFNKGYQVLVDEGLVPPRTFAAADLADFIGLTAEEAWTKHFPNLPDGAWERAAARVGVAMDELIENGTARLYPGVPDMLARLKADGYALVFLSNCRLDYQEASRRAFGLDAYFSAYYNAEENPGKSKEEIFVDIAQAFPGGYAVVGDRYKDLNLARAHTLPSVGCLYGYGTREELAGATELVERAADIAPAVERIDAQLG